MVGNRLHRHPDGMSKLRYVWNVRLSELIGQLAGVGLADSQSDFRIFGADTARITLSAAYTYTQEQIIRVARAGVPVTQLPIAFGPRLDGRSRLMRSPAHYLSRVFADLDSLLEEMGIDSGNL